MRESEVVLTNRLGLHARAAAKLVRAAKEFESSVSLECERSGMADAKSILSVLAIAAAKGTALRLITEGPDEEQALREIKVLFEEKFGEDQ